MHARVRELVDSVTRFHRCQIAVKLEYYAYCIEHEDGLVESKTNYIERPNASACPCYANVACYTGAAAHNVGDCENVVNEIYKNWPTEMMLYTNSCLYILRYRSALKRENWDNEKLCLN